MTNQTNKRSRNRILGAMIVVGMLGAVMLFSLRLTGRATGAEGEEVGGCGGAPVESSGTATNELATDVQLNQNLGLLSSAGKTLNQSVQRIKPGGSLSFDVVEDDVRAILALDAQGGDALTITDDEVGPASGGTLHRFKIAAASNAVPGTKLTLRSMAVWPVRDDPSWSFGLEVQIVP